MRKAALSAALAIVLTACGKIRSGGLPNIRYGVDVCDRCGMILSEERFAAGYVDAQGKNVVYDDIGEFLQVAAAHPEIIMISFVHDAEESRWLRASKACFVRAPSLATPMGSGFAAFADRDRAATFARRSGGSATVLTIGEATAIK